MPHWKGANRKSEGGYTKLSSMDFNLKGLVAS
jgi:hypothetical protein